MSATGSYRRTWLKNTAVRLGPFNDASLRQRRSAVAAMLNAKQYCIKRSRRFITEEVRRRIDSKHVAVARPRDSQRDRNGQAVATKQRPVAAGKFPGDRSFFFLGIPPTVAPWPVGHGTERTMKLNGFRADWQGIERVVGLLSSGYRGASADGKSRQISLAE